MASSAPATSVKVTFGASLETILALDLPNCMTLPPPPCMFCISRKNTTRISMNGSTVARIEASAPVCSGSNSTEPISPCSTQFAIWSSLIWGL